MKQFSILFNIFLLAALGVLYYLHFSTGKTNNPVRKTLANSHKDTCSAGPGIAYVELDSLNNNVGFIKERKKELESEQKQILNEYESACRQQETEKNNFIKRGNSITQTEAEEFQAKWIQRQQELDATKQSKGQRLAEKGGKIMEEVQLTLKGFLNDYNKDKRYSYIFATGGGFDYLFYKDSTQNITNEIIKGLNERMNKKGK